MRTDNPTPRHCSLVTVVKKMIVAIELTVPWEERCEEAYQRKKEKYTELMTTCRERGWKAWLFPVEVGCRGFPAQSVWRMLQAMGIVGKARKTAVRQLGEAAERSSCWLWHRRDDLSWKPSADELEPSEDIKAPAESERDSEMKEDEQSREYDSRKAEYHHLRRKQKLNELMMECKLKSNSKGLTFINVNGIDTSAIDYFLYTDLKCEPSKRLIDLSSNVSDHHPISLRIKCNIAREQQPKNPEKQKQKVIWNKVDKSRYEETINREIGDYVGMVNSDIINIELIILQAMNLLSNTAKQLDQQKTDGKNKLKLNIWNEEISESLAANKLAYKNWKTLSWTAIRNEEIRRKHYERNDIINYNQNDKQKFFKLIRKQRQNRNTFINDLHVENELFERDNIINGWNQHFSKLAVPSEHPDFNYQHLALCELDYNSIKRISEHYVTKHVDLDTIEKAIKSINRGKAEDIFGISKTSYFLITDSRIKWSTEISEKFPVLQGVKQGELLGADLYKVYIEDLLNTFENTTSGCEIGETLINAVACADDVAIVSENPHELQYLVNIAAQYSEDHHYLLQPLKSVVLQVHATLKPEKKTGRFSTHIYK
ncbi:unnamed protein product [Mytilus coruscus]|uniref:Reverse transcriptase domain-containing protein n=1 Tax=Mytilus coruscus TaxID=42192 RepID=A0A6J8BTB1_MYTCO|nr:unnamed protein product [Mytilus coruscus]